MPDPVTINRRLNLVAPITRPDGSMVTVHSMPISRETIEQFNVVLARTFAAIFELGVGDSTGPVVAVSMLKTIASQLNQWDVVQSQLLTEIHRLTTVIVADAGQWKPIPWDVAIQRGLLDADDAAEVTGALVFFTAVSAMSRRAQVAERLENPGRVWGFKLTLSTPMDYVSSLPTLTPPASSTAKPTQASSVPH